MFIVCEEQSTEVTEEKSTFVVAGRRIIDIELVANCLARGCSTCKSELRLLDIVSENRQGLASIFSIKCQSCGILNAVQTSKTVAGMTGKRRTFSINAKAAVGEC